MSVLLLAPTATPARKRADRRARAWVVATAPPLLVFLAMAVAHDTPITTDAVALILGLGVVAGATLRGVVERLASGRPAPAKARRAKPQAKAGRA